MDTTDDSRRWFLRATGGTLSAAWLATHWPGIAAAAEHAHDMMSMSADTADRTSFLILSLAQARDVEAIAAQIVPSGATPGAREAGVVYFIDHVHAGLFQKQSAAFLAGLQHFQAQVSRHYAGVAQFADLPPEDQFAFLGHMQHTPFFKQMRALTIMGLLALPSYGGNAGKLGWQVVGFVDRHVWQPPYGVYDRDYPGFVPYPGTKLRS